MPGTGWVEAWNTPEGDRGVFSSLTASFRDDGWSPVPAACTASPDGPCLVFECPDGLKDSAPPPETAERSAGSITVAGPQRTLTLEPDPAGGYAEKIEAGAFWRPGDPVTIMASGAIVPGFSATLRAPTPLTVTQPASEATLGSAEDLVLRWTGGGVGDAIFDITKNRTDKKEAPRAWRCTFPAAAGTGTIKRAGLGGPGILAISPRSVSQQKLDGRGWSLTLSLVTPGAFPCVSFPLPGVLHLE